MPNTPSDELWFSAVATIQEAWPGLDDRMMAHVFGDRVPGEVRREAEPAREIPGFPPF